MIRKMWNILQSYKANKGRLDKRYQNAKADALSMYSEDHYKTEIEPEQEKAYKAQTRVLKGAALDMIERIATNAETYVNAAINNVNYYHILEAESLKDVPLTDREINALLNRYSDDTYASRVFIGILNDRNDPMHQRAISYPEDTLAIVNDVLRDSALLINAYSGEPDMTTPQGRINYISVANIEARFLDYGDRLNQTCFPDLMLDIPLPLTPAEEKQVDSLFKGCTTYESRSNRAAELAKQGYAPLIARSEYASNLPRFYKEDVNLDALQGLAIKATESKYAGTAQEWAIKDLGEYASLLDDSAENQNAFDVLSQWAIDHGFSVSLDNIGDSTDSVEPESA